MARFPPCVAARAAREREGGSSSGSVERAGADDAAAICARVREAGGKDPVGDPEGALEESIGDSDNTRPLRREGRSDEVREGRRIGRDREEALDDGRLEARC